MTLDDFVAKVKAGEAVDFQDTMDIISQHYDYQSTEFSNGLAEPVLNEAGRNEGSCKLFAFAQLQAFSQAQTLALFGDYYRKDVLGNPEGSDHQNIRTFIRDGWDGIQFKGQPLTPKRAD